MGVGVGGDSLTLASGTTALGGALGVETLEVDVGVVDVAHQLGDGPVAGLLGDEPVHVLDDLAVLGMALRPAAQLDEVHRLAGVHLHDVADAEGEADGVARLVRELRPERLVEGSRRGPSPPRTRCSAGLDDGVGQCVAVVGR